MSYYGNDQDGPNWGRIIWAVVIVVGLVISILVAMWQLGFWFKEQGTNRNDQIYSQSYGAQEGLKESVSKNIALVLTESTQLDNVEPGSQSETDLKAQRIATLGMVCATAVKINPAVPLAAEQASFVATNCTMGVVSPTSAYRV